MHKMRNIVSSKNEKSFPGILVVLTIGLALCFICVGCTRFHPDKPTPKSGPLVIWKNNGFVDAVAASPNGSAIAAAGSSIRGATVVKTWSIPSLISSKELPTNISFCTALRFSPDGKHLAGSGDNGNIYMWDASLRAKLWQAKHGYFIQALDYSPDGSEVASEGPGEKQIASSKPGTKGLLTLTGTDRVRIWNTLTGKLIATIDDIDGGIKAFKFIANDKLILFQHTNSKVFKVFQVHITSSPDKPRLLYTLEPGKEVTTTAISPDGNTIATGGPRGNVTVWHLNHSDVTSQKLSAKSIVKSIATALTFSPDGKKLIIATLNKTSTPSSSTSLLLWDVEKNTVVNSLWEETLRKENGGVIVSVAFVPHSKWIVFSDVKSMQAWNYGG